MVTTNPIVSERNQRLGTVGEWRDRTAEIAVEKEVAAIVGAAANGDFGQRVDVAGKSGFFLKLAEDLNRLLEYQPKGPGGRGARARLPSRMAICPKASMPTMPVPSGS